MKKQIKLSKNEWILAASASGIILMLVIAWPLMNSRGVKSQSVTVPTEDNNNVPVVEDRISVKDNMEMSLTPQHPLPERVLNIEESTPDDASSDNSSNSEIVRELVAKQPLADKKITQSLQSPARPFGLDITAPVQMAGADSQSENFVDNVLPSLLDYVELNVVGNTSIKLISTEASPYNLRLTDAADIRVYFVGEEAAFHNSIGLNIEGIESELVFPDASTPYSYYLDNDTRQNLPTKDCPLIPGDFVDVGEAQSGSSLDFFIIPDGARNANTVYGIDKELNEDQISHVRILGIVGDSMILIGFEDLKNGGDQDYDDVMIAIEIGKQNVRSISANLDW